MISRDFFFFRDLCKEFYTFNLNDPNLKLVKCGLRGVCFEKNSVYPGL